MATQLDIFGNAGLSEQPVFFNTTKESGTVLETCKESAQTQNDIVEFYFKSVQQGKTACEVHAELIRAKLISGCVPLTSVRRSITVLCNEGKLKNTGEKRIGIYGRNNWVWQKV